MDKKNLMFVILKKKSPKISTFCENLEEKPIYLNIRN